MKVLKGNCKGSCKNVVKNIKKIKGETVTGKDVMTERQEKADAA